MRRRAIFLRIYLAAFLSDGSYYVVLTVVALRAIAMDASSVQLGLLPVFGSGAYVLAALGLGRMSDRWPRFAMARLGAVLRAGAILGVISADNPVALICWMPLLGASNGFFWPGLQAVLGGLAEEKQLGRVLGGFNVGWSSGKMLGFFLGGLFLDGLGPGAVLTMAAIATLAPVLVLPWKEVRNRSAVELRAPSPVPISVPRIGTLADDRSGRAVSESELRLWSTWRRLGWAANFLLFGLGATLNFHYPKFLDAQGLGGGTVFGVFLGIVYLSQTISFVVMGLRQDWPFRLAPLVLAQLGCALAVASLLWLRTPIAIWAVAPLVGVGLGFAYASSIYYSLHGAPAKGQNSGIHEALLGSGSFVLPFLAGVLVDLSGSLAAPYVLLAVALASLVGFETWRVRTMETAR